MKLKPIDLAGPLGMALFIVAVQAISLILAAPLSSSKMQAFPDSGSLLNPLIYIVLIIVSTAVMLIIIKFNLRWLIRAFFIFAVFSTLIYVMFGVGTLLLPGSWSVSIAGLVLPSWAIVGAASAVISLVLSLLMVVYPEWYVIDTVGVLIAAGASALFGISLSILPTILLLILLAVYDFISVYQTKHMIKLAEGVMDLKLPVLFVLPRKTGYSYVHSQVQKLGEGKEREAYFMGLGDAVMPTILVVSANVFVSSGPVLLFFNVPALGAMIGTLVSYVALMYFVMKGKPQAGLPFLCSGAIIGFLLGCAAIGYNPF